MFNHRLFVAQFITRPCTTLLFITILVSIFAYSHTGAEPNNPNRQKNIKSGEEAYKKYCSACHGRTGIGDGPGAIISGIPPRDLTNKAYMSLLSDEDLFKRVRFGEEAVEYLQMAGIEHKASQWTIWNIVDYILTLQVDKGPYKGLTPKEQEERFEDPLERGGFITYDIVHPAMVNLEMARGGPPEV